MNESNAMRYLSLYGYASGRGGQAAAVRRFQSDFGDLKTDGILGPKTLRAMETPRCGCTPAMLQAAQAEAAIAKWPDRNWQSDPLLYSFSKFVGGISPAIQRDLFKSAVDSWSAVCGIAAREARKAEKADVEISAGRGRRYNFDGPGRTLAWAYVAGGLMMFDEDEIWTAERSTNGIPYENVAAHEWGHIIGCGHSNIQAALMAPFMNRNVWRPVSPDDVEEGQKRYGYPDDSDGGDNGGGSAPRSPIVINFDPATTQVAVDTNQGWIELR